MVQGRGGKYREVVNLPRFYKNCQNSIYKSRILLKMSIFKYFMTMSYISFKNEKITIIKMEKYCRCTEKVMDKVINHYTRMQDKYLYF